MPIGETYVEYHNLGFHQADRLSDAAWQRLEEAGWNVTWFSQHNRETAAWWEANKDDLDDDERAIGPGLFDLDDEGRLARPLFGPPPRARAKQAHKTFGSLREALREFERVTGRDVTETFDTPEETVAHHAFRYERDGPEPIGERAGMIGGDECVAILYDEAPGSLREAAETIAELRARLRQE